MPGLSYEQLVVELKQHRELSGSTPLDHRPVPEQRERRLPWTFGLGDA